MRFKIILCFTLAIWVCSVNAQQRLSVEQAIDLGIKNNTSVANARLDVKLAKKKILETVAIGLPKISGEVNWQQFLEIPTTVVPANMFLPDAPADEFNELQFGTEHNASSTLSASQLIFDGSYIVGLKASSIYKSLAYQSLELTEEQITDSLAAAYYNILVAEERSDFLQLIADIHQEVLEEVKISFEQGMVEDLEVDKMTLLLSNMRIQAENMQKMTNVARLYFKLILGIPLEDELILTDSLNTIMQAHADLQLVEPSVENRIEYQLAETQTRLKKLDLRRYQSQLLPSVSAFASVSNNAFRNNFDFFEDGGKWYPTQLIGIKASMSLFDGFSRLSKIQQAKIEYLKAKNNQSQLSESLKLAHQSALANYVTTFNTQKQTAENLELSKKIYFKTLTKYREGLVSSTALSQAGADYSEAQADNAQAIYNFLIAKTNYNRSVGKQ